jgi:hypothetical protein
VRRDGRPWVNFYDLQRRHEHLVAESSQALRRQREEIDRRGQQILAQSRQAARLHHLIFLLVDSLDGQDQADLQHDPSVAAAFRIWQRGRARAARASEEGVS